MEKHTFPYRLQGPSLTVIGLLIGVFGFLMVFMAWLEGDRFIGVPVGYPIGALLYLAIAAVAFLAIFLMAKAWQSQRKGGRDITFEQDRVYLPKTPFSNEIISIRYASIQEVSQQSVSRAAMTFIRIKHDLGTTQISDLGFETTDMFEDVYRLLRKRSGK